MTSTTFPSRAEDLTSEWLTDILRASGVSDDVTVSGVSVAPVSDPGQTSQAVRIALEYEKAGPEAPSSLIGKFPTEFEQARTYAQSAGAYLKEVQFFRIIAPSAGNLVPRCFAAEIDEESHDFVLILEDLADLQVGKTFDFDSYVGNSSLMLERLAPFHARWWNHPDLETFDWIPRPGTAAYTEYMRMGEEWLSACLPPVKQAFEKYMSDDAWGVIEKFLSSYGDLTEYASKHPRFPLTITHGDLHQKQCFFPTGRDDRFAVIDWQGVGINVAAADVVRALLFEPERRRAHENGMVARYHSLLVKNGVGDYSVEELWEDIRLSSLAVAELFIAAIAQTDTDLLTAKAAEKGVDAYEVILTWLGSALDDWGVGQALDRLLARARATGGAGTA